MRLEGGVLLSLRARVCVCLRRETWEASHNISAAKHRNPLSMLWRPAVVINNGNCAKLNPPRGHSPTCGRRRLPRFAPPPFSPFFFPTFRILEQASYSGSCYREIRGSFRKRNFASESCCSGFFLLKRKNLRRWKNWRIRSSNMLDSGLRATVIYLVEILVKFSPEYSI